MARRAACVSLLVVLGTLFSAGAAQAEPSVECQQDWPEGRERPRLQDSFPVRGVAGHVAWLQVEVSHLPGESVMPAGVDGMRLRAAAKGDDDASSDLDRLEKAHFTLPATESAVRPSIERIGSDDGERVTTRVRVPLIPLPEEAGRFELTLPRLPVAVARASGQVHTLCTSPHVITVEDPLASEAQVEPRPDPEPRPQVEVWTSLRDVVLTLFWALPLAALVAWLLIRYRDKFKKKPAPPPPVPPWDVARARLSALEASGLFSSGKYEEYLDEVSDALREYLGGRYGFDGLESTTRELLRQLGTRAPDFAFEQDVRTILQRTDLVKFARRTPSEEECRDAMSVTRKIVERTMPSPVLDPRATASVRDREKTRGESPRDDSRSSQTGGDQP